MKNTLKAVVITMSNKLCFALEFKRAFKKFCFYLQINYFSIFESFWCADIKNKIKEYFNMFPNKNNIL